MHFTVTVLVGAYGIGDVLLKRPPELRLLEDLFGEGRVRKPNPEFSRAKSTIHTFDEAGVWLYEEGKVVKQVSFLFCEPLPRVDFHPAKVFCGALSISGRKVKCVDDFFAVESDEMDLNEWETEGSASMTLGRLRCDLWRNPKSRAIQDISLWFP